MQIYRAGTHNMGDLCKLAVIAVESLYTHMRPYTLAKSLDYRTLYSRAGAQ